MRVKDLLKNQPRAVAILTERQTIKEAIETMRTSDAGAVVVASDRVPTGILTRSDLIRVWAEGPEKAFQSTELRKAISSPLITAATDDDIAATLAMMVQAGIGYVPVCEDGQIIAILSIRDLMGHHIEALQGELDQINEYIDRLHDAYED